MCGRVRRSRRFAIPAGAVVCLLVAGHAPAQWLKVPLAGTPRRADGSPDLTAPAPRTPQGQVDLSGIWRRMRGAGVNIANLAAGIDVLLTPSAEAVFKTRQADNSKDMPSGRCLPHGLTKAMSVPEPFKIVQTPSLILILYEEFNHYRQIVIGARTDLDKRPRAWFGRSAGRWDRDEALVVETIGFKDDAWLDVAGHPATEALRITERYRRRDFGRLEVQFTIDDPNSYVKPWGFSMIFELLPDTELIEHFCENELDQGHLVGK